MKLLVGSILMSFCLVGVAQEVHQVDRTDQLSNLDPPVVRCVLDEYPRMVLVDLGEGHWGAWSSVFGSFYKVWSGEVNFDGAVFTTRHGPQPVSRGQKVIPGGAMDAIPWGVRRNGSLQKTPFRWKGYRIKKGIPTLSYMLVDKSGKGVEIQETPTLYKDQKGKYRFKREVKVFGSWSDAVVEWSLPNRHGDGSRVVYFDGKANKPLARSLGRTRILRIPHGESRIIEAVCLKTGNGSAP